MSLEALALVIDFAPYGDARTMLVLLSLAEWANKDGVSWYSVPKIARRARCSVRQAQTILKVLSAPDKQGRKMVSIKARPGRPCAAHSNMYRLNLPLLRELADQARAQEAAAGIVKPTAPLPTDNREVGRTEIVKSSVENSEAHFTQNQIRTQNRTKNPKPHTSLALSVGDSPALRSGGGQEEPSDPRHAPVRDLIQRLHREAFGIACPWSGREASSLKRLLKSNQTWTVEQVLVMVRHRFASEDIAPDLKWLSRIGEYVAGPLDRYGKLQNGHKGSPRTLELSTNFEDLRQDAQRGVQ